jgi:parallel beta-helix repeat protein
MDHITVEDCIFEHTNASGATFTGKNIVIRNCTFQHNGQLGFGANRAHGLRLTGCTVRDNNTKGFDRGWEAGGDKICLTSGAVLEDCIFSENRGNGIWFDIGNEDCEVHNCLIANNENAGIFYEISYGLRAHDNVIIGNGFAFTSGAWGASAGISLSSSPGCTIERNLLLGNKEGFNFREQSRSTPRVDNRQSEPVWNHNQIIRRNVLAYNRDAQVWGWFDVADQRHWPKSMQTESEARPPASEQPEQASDQPTGLSLEDLHLAFEGNLYWPSPGQDLFNWGVTWKKHQRYADLDKLREDLSIDQRGEVNEFHVQDYSAEYDGEHGQQEGNLLVAASVTIRRTSHRHLSYTDPGHHRSASGFWSLLSGVNDTRSVTNCFGRQGTMTARSHISYGEPRSLSSTSVAVA